MERRIKELETRIVATQCDSSSSSAPGSDIESPSQFWEKPTAPQPSKFDEINTNSNHPAAFFDDSYLRLSLEKWDVRTSMSMGLRVQM